MKGSKEGVKRYIYGVAYNSGGKHKSTEGNVTTPSYSVWFDMIRRCYSKDFHKERPHHKDCTVCEEWLDFQNFAEWYKSQPFTGRGTQLDKDILVKGNTIYSPETCIVVPKDINMFFVHAKKKSSGLPLGVRKITNYDGYQVSVSNRGVNTYVGSSKTIEGAFLIYKTKKEAYAKSLAMQYKDQLCPRAFKAIMEWEVHIDD